MEPNKDQNCDKIKEEPIKEEEKDLEYYNFTQNDTDIKIENNLETPQNSNIENLIIVEQSNLIKEESPQKNPFEVKCDYCDETFDNDQNLHVKMKNHVDYRHKIQIPKVSDEKNSNENKNEKRHEKVESNSGHKSKIPVKHLGPSMPENRFRCPFCVVTFAFESGLVKHKKSFHKEEFEEEIRAEKRKRDASDDLIAARKARNASARIKCDSCDQICSDKDELENHIAEVHERKNPLIDDKVQKREKENQCSVCLNVFDHTGTFNRHILRKHEYKCEFCELRFVTSVIMRDHMNLVHPNEFRPKINCPYCQEPFEAMSAMQKHLKNEHKPNQNR